MDKVGKGITTAGKATVSAGVFVGEKAVAIGTAIKVSLMKIMIYVY